MSAATLLDRLDGVKQTAPDRWMARCPAHQDKTPSLSIREVGDGLVLLKCFSECDTEDVLAAVGMKFADLFPEPMRKNREFLPHWLPPKRRRYQIPLRDLIEVLSHDVSIVAILARAMLDGRHSEITDQDWVDFEHAAKRLWRARDHLHE